MKPPITIDDHGDISLFEAVEDAERYVEPIDVTSNDLVAYDSEGRLLRGRIVKRGFLNLGRAVRLEPAENEPLHAPVLRERLIGFLIKLGEPRDPLEAASLDALIARGLSLLAPPRKRRKA
jgi:hypothetical protein